MPLTIRSRFVTLWITLVAALGWPRPAPAQVGQAFVYVTNVTAVQLSNAVRVTVQADGTLQAYVTDALVAQVFDFGKTDVIPKPLRRLTIRLGNARSKIGSIKQVGMYPVDHLEFGIPEDSQNGIGLDVTLVLDTDAKVRNLVFPDFGPSTPPPAPSVTIIVSPDQRSLIFTITSDRFPEQKPTHKLAGVGPEELSVHSHDGLIDVAAANAPLSAVLRAVSEQSGVPVVVEPAADRVTSVVLRDQPPEQVITMLAGVYGLDLSVQDGALLVTGGEFGDAAGGGVTAVTLKHLSADAAVTLLPTFLLHYTQADPTNNRVVVSGSPWLRDKVSRDLAVLDVPAPHVRVGVTFVTYTRSDDFVQTVQMAETASHTSISAAAGVAGAPSGLMVFQHGNGNTPGIDAALKSLSVGAELHIDSRPTLLLANGQPGSLFEGTTYYVPDPTTFSGSLDQLNVGTQLNLTPSAGVGGWITLQIDTSSSDLESSDPVTHLPVIESRRVTSTVRIQSGDTLFLGGLEQDQQVVNRFKIPLLGDIPLLGRLFRGRTTHRQKVRIGVFVTATVVPA